MSSKPETQIDFDRIGGLVMWELHRRLGSAELAQDLPGTLLMKVAMDYVKHLEVRNQIEQAKLEQVKLDPLEMIDQPGLNVETRLVILGEYMTELTGTLENVLVRVDELRDLYFKENPEDGEVVQDVQDVVPAA